MLLLEKVDSIPVTAREDSRLTKISRRVFSFPVMLATLLVVLAVLTVRSRFNDPDMWWHLKVGEIIWNTHTIPTSDLFSFTTNNHAWTPHEWLSQLIMYSTWKLGGYAGLMVWLCVATSIFLIAVYTLCAVYSGNAKVALIGALAAWEFGTVGMANRPHMIGYLLLTCELLIIHLGRSRDRRWLWVLPPLFAVWVNCHGSFFFGLMVLAIFLACSWIGFRTGSLVSFRWDEASRKTLTAVFALTILALFLNPSGLKQLIYPLDTMLNQTTSMEFIEEWQPLTFVNVRDLTFLAVAGSIFLVVLLRHAELRLEELLLVGLGFGMAIRHGRMLFVFGVLVAPVFSRLLSNLWDGYEPARDRRAPNLVMMLAAFTVVAVAFPRTTDLQRQVNQANPVKAVEFIRHAGLSGRMLNDYSYGGYLIWAAPEHKVFVDGRADIFDWTGVLGEYQRWWLLRENPESLLDKYKIDLCLMSRNAGITQVLPYLPGWKRIYGDDLSVIFARGTALQAARQFSAQPGR